MSAAESCLLDLALPIAVSLVIAVLIHKLFSGTSAKRFYELKKPPYGYRRKDGYLYSRCLADDEELTSTCSEDCKTIHEMFTTVVKQHGDEPAFGQRQLLRRDIEEQDGKKFEKLTLAPSYDWMTYKEAEEYTANIASGMVAFAALKPKDKIVIYAETQRDWMTTCLAAFRQNLTVVTVYATLGEEGAKYGVHQTRAKVIVCDRKLFPVVENILPSCPTVKSVILIGANDTPKTQAFQVKRLEELVESGKAKPLKASPPSQQDIGVIMYTSGTTGRPKGVMLTHGNMTASVGAFERQFKPMRQGDDTFLAYLPLAHIMELVLELTILCVGAKLGYGNPHTLTDTGVKLQKGCRGDAVTLKPTYMVFAPAVLDKVYNAVQNKLSDAPWIRKKLFDVALAAGYKNYDNGIVGAPPFHNALVFKKIQKIIGGRVGGMGTGSAPLSAEIQKFMQTVFNAPVRQGYGLTETCSTGTLGEVSDNATNQVGPPATSVAIRLVDWEEGGYVAADEQNPEIGMPRGEVLIGGPSVSVGYWVDPDDPDVEVQLKNKKEFSEQGGLRWFHTGDIGQITKEGTLQIIDRKKDLFKGPQGEYVSLSKVESILKLSPYVDMPMVYGKQGSNNVVALICPNDVSVKKFAKANGINETSMIKLCQNKQVVGEVKKSCVELCKQNGLVKFEIPPAYGLVVDGEGGPAWTPENDLLTAAMKLKRPVIAKAFKDNIDALY